MDEERVKSMLERLKVSSGENPEWQDAPSAQPQTFTACETAMSTSVAATPPLRYELKFSMVNRRYITFLIALMCIPFIRISFIFMTLPASNHPFTILSSFAFSLIFPMLCFLPLLLPAKLKLSENGIWFSLQWLTLGNKRLRSWDDLHSIQLIYPTIAVPEDTPILWRGDKHPLKTWLTPSKWMYGPWLMLDFASGGTARIILSRLTRQQAQQLFQALDTYNSSSKFASEVVNLERSLILGGDDILSFTKMWEDQLNSNYISTNYVPLPTNYKFQNGEYKVLMELGAGGMSAVYLAETRDGKKVVLKEAVTPPGTDERQRLKSRELFEREATLLMRLNHPQIAKVLDYFVERGRDYLVLEFVKGQTLKQLVKEKGKQKESQVLQWTTQIADIVQYLHSQNPPILHRDLTPDNLILSDNGQVKLVDFGAASEYVGSATGTFIGKQCYIPPEQLRGKAVPQSDLYALGGTMNFLLTGKDPVALSQSNPKEMEPTVSQGVSDLVADLTSLEAEDRPDDAALSNRLENLTSTKKSFVAKA
ncbi:MAG TPA: serine/threonine-protein kinase [Planktothrix sp.]|jgi:tRNA A-37 threonylcarbamoyl transferase component Bud32